jgi:beta-glucanase (GH16 family)/SOS-response transcriptional repressor LexA
MKTKLLLRCSILLCCIVGHFRGNAQCWDLVWADEFNGTSLDQTKWSYQLGTGCDINLCGWGNNELQTYTSRPENISVSNGNLIITARKENYGGREYTSARIRTINKGDFTYGRIEARMKLPKGQGLWPAFWMLPTDNVYGGWPASGEIDIMELRGEQPNVSLGTIHYGPAWPNNRHSGGSYTLPSGDFSQAFHTFSVDWEPNRIRWYIDGNLFYTATPSTTSPYTWPFDQRFYILLNLAVGGNFLQNPPSNANYFPQTMEVDYVRVYKSTTCTQPPVANFTISKSTACTGETVTFSNTSTGSISSYSWNFGSGASPATASGAGPHSVTYSTTGSKTVTLTATGPGGSNTRTSTLTINNCSVQSPYLNIVRSIPGRIEAEHFDEGGQTIAYSDNSAGNTGGVFRNTDVDIEASTDAGGGYNIGWIAAGEWLEYSVNVSVAGRYDIEARVASISGAKTFRVEMNGVNVSGPISVPATGAWQSWQTVKVADVDLTAGQRVMRIFFESGDFNLNYINFIRKDIQTPYGGTPISLPGRIEAENYDLGGQGIAFNETTAGNSGAVYRTDGVDIEATTDAGGGYNIGWISAGEWLEYTVNVTQSGTYRFDARVATINPSRTFRIEVDGANVTGSIAVPNTGGWQTWQTVSATDINLSAGQKVIRIFMESSDFNINYFNVVRIGNMQIPYNGSAATVPGRIEAENYDQGGQDISFNETTAGNSGGVFRNDAVDIQPTTDAGGGYNIGWVAAGEWLEYTVNVSAAAFYNFSFRVATPFAGKSLTLFIDGVNRGTVAVPNTGGWQNWTNVSLNGISISSGQRVIRILMNASEFNLNYFTASTSAAKLGSFDEEVQEISGIYPNPASDFIKLPSGTNHASVILFDSFGREVLNGDYSEHEVIDLRSLPAGIYIVKVNEGEMIYTQRIVKK